MFIILKYQKKLKDLSICKNINALLSYLNDLNILEIKDKIFEIEFMLSFKQEEINFIKKKIELYLMQDEKDPVQEFYAGKIIIFLEQYTELIKKLLENYSFAISEDYHKDIKRDNQSSKDIDDNFHSFGGL